MRLIQQIIIAGALIVTSTCAFAAAEVSTVTIVYSNYQPTLKSTGTLLAAQGLTMQPETSGRISKILFQSGDNVKEGTPLIELNNDILKAELALNQANLELSEHDYQRKLELFKKRVVSKSEIDTAQATLKINQARVAGTRAQLAQTIITAPFSGRLGLQLVSVGDIVTSATKLVNLQAVDPIYIDFTIPETNITQVAVGQKIELTDDAYPGKKFIGKIKAFESVINQNAQSLTVRAEVPNTNQTLVPGTFMAVTVFTSKPENVINIPQTALMYDSEGNYVYRVIKDKAVRTNVTTGVQTKQHIAITKGLSAGDVVITAGQIKLQNGSEVSVEKTAAKKEK